MSIYCHCDNCLFASPSKLEECETPKTLTQMLAEVKQEQEEMGFDEDTHYTSKKCPGFTTSIYRYECENKLDSDESICSYCESEKERVENYEDDAVERYYQRQLEIEEEQLVRMEDHDGDEG